MTAVENVANNVGKITGNTESGSYDTDTNAEKAANAGEQVGELLNGGNKDVSTKNDITYDGDSNDGEIDVDAGLAYASEVVDSIDQNENGAIDLNNENEKQKAEEGLGIEDISAADANADGLVDKAEYLSLTILQDCTSEAGPDGIATAEEAKALNEIIKSDAELIKSQVRAINTEVVSPAVANFEMPLTKLEKALDIAEQAEIKAENNAKQISQNAKTIEELQQDKKNLGLIMQLLMLMQTLGLPLGTIESMAESMGIDISEYLPMFKGQTNSAQNTMNSNLFNLFGTQVNDTTNPFLVKPY